MSDRNSQRRRLLFIGWDAADWKLIAPLLDSGKMQNLRRLVEQGSMGSLSSLAPRVSPLLWTSIATGKRADRHGILTSIEPDPATGTSRPIGAAACKSDRVWDLLGRAGFKSHVVNWCATHPAEAAAGIIVSDRFAEPAITGAVQPDRYQPIFDELRIHPSDMSAEHMLPFIPRLAEIDQDRDRRATRVAAILAESVTVHAAATWIMEHEEWDFLAVHYRGLEQWAGEFGRYTPKPMPGISARDGEIYGNVVESGHRFYDMMLGRLLQLAGGDANVMLVSDRGNRGRGIVCLRGPEIRADELIHGAGLLDIAPTILTLFGLGVPSDMEGRPLLAAWTEPPTVVHLPAFNDERTETEPVADSQPDTPAELEAALRDLQSQGYDDGLTDALSALDREGKQTANLHLVQVHLGAGCPERALPLLEQLHREKPTGEFVSLLLAYSHYSLRQFDRCREVLGTLPHNSIDQPLAQLMLAMISLAEGHPAEALDRLTAAAPPTHRREPQVMCFMGHAYRQLDRHAEAQAAFERCLAIDADWAPAHFGLALSYGQQRLWAESADWALRAVGVNHFQPEAHFLLGVALAQMGDAYRAIVAFENAVAQRPTHAGAHAWLAKIHHRVTGDANKAAHHHTLAHTGRHFQGAS